MLTGIIIGVLAAALLFGVVMFRTKRKNNDPLQQQVANELREIFQGYFRASVEDQKERQRRLAELVGKYHAQGVSMRQIGHSITMLNTVLAADDMKHLRDTATDWAKFGLLKM